jgi:murein DD-endopeptidase MepM/ murein hydrolase activator NlpD
MKHTVRFAHLAEKPNWHTGDIIKTGNVIGIMGTSGQSNAKHLHIDCAECEQTKTFVLVDYSNGNKVASKEQLDYFIDDELFGIEPVITTQYDDPEYRKTYGKWHKGYDVVPEDRHETEKHFAIHWNRSMQGKVSLVGFDQNGYGNFIYITFETKDKPSEKSNKVAG